MKHFRLQKALLNGELDRPVYIELLKQLYGDEKRLALVMQLHHSLYGLEDASKIWFELIRDTFGAAGVKEMRSAPCLLQGNGIIALCYVHDLFVFGKTKQKIDQLKIKLQKDLIMKDLGRPR